MPISVSPSPASDLRLRRRGLLAGLGGIALAGAASLPALAAPTTPASWRARSRVNVRQGPGTRYAKLGVLAAGDTVAAASDQSHATSAWRAVNYRGGTAYVSATYLVAVGVPITSTPVQAPVVTRSTAIVPSALAPHARAVAEAVIANFPAVTTMYGRRYEPGSDHMTGHAVDIMLPLPYTSAEHRQLGYEIAAYMQANRDQLGVHYVIYRQHIWNIQRDAEGWRPMANRGDDTANHMDHVHVSVF